MYPYLPRLETTTSSNHFISGDNFGVQIQEGLSYTISSLEAALIGSMYAEALNELHRSQESAYSLRDASRLHHLSRAKICSKLIKYPNVEDYTVRPKSYPSAGDKNPKSYDSLL